MCDNYFAELNGINVNDKTEKKNGLTYLSWAYAWCELKKKHPDAFYTVYENAQGWNYFTDGRTCWVKTGVTVNGIEHIEYLPIMNVRNQSIAANAVTSFDVNKAIQRSLTKAVARHGLGLYVYAGEDLPDEEQPESPPVPEPETPPAPVKDTISVAQQKEIVAKWQDKHGEIKTDEDKIAYGMLLSAFGAKKTADIKIVDFEKVLEAIE